VASAIRLLVPQVEIHPRDLGAYAPRDGVVAEALGTLVRAVATEIASRVLTEAGADHELKTVFARLEPDRHDRPFASVQVLVEVVRIDSGRTVYTRSVESEVRRLIQAPVPLDDERFGRTALGRATTSCLRSLFTALSDTFA
jgi:hypothetical protein